MLLTNKDLTKVNDNVLDFIKDYCDLKVSEENTINTGNLNSIEEMSNLNLLINLYRINDIRFINKFFEEINIKLQSEGIYISCVETFQARKERKKIGKIPVLGFFYFGFEFVFMRVIPKINIFKQFYFFITKGKNRLLSKAETLGRLISCGFDIVSYKTIDGKLFIISKKVAAPKYDMKPSYGPIYSMPRVGKSNKIINVYKLRTMHPYSEYLQDYIFERNGTANGDKVNDDFRISPIGKVFRKFWIDELPMLINLVKGDIKIVGVRPLSVGKFNMYPEKARQERIRFKPGLVPPFYADLPNNFEELIESELRYIERYSKSPILTDVKYFFKAFSNIIFKGARSK